MQGDGTPSRLYSAADLEAGPAMQHNAAEHKQMDEFFSEVTVIRVRFNGKKGVHHHISFVHLCDCFRRSLRASKRLRKSCLQLMTRAK